MVVPYFGSKKRLAKWIDSYLPLNRSGLTFIEPYCGSASVSLSVSPFSDLVLNDLYFPVINFHRYVQLKPELLIQQIREILPYYALEIPSYESTLLAAAKFYLYSKFSFSGGGTRWSTGEIARKVRLNFDEIKIASERLQDAQILCQNAIDVIDFYDLPDVVLYVDPTYLNSTRATKDNRVKNQVDSLTRKQYMYEMSENDHIDLLERLSYFSGKCIISGFDSPLYDSALVGWQKEFKFTRSTSSVTKEVLWISP